MTNRLMVGCRLRIDLSSGAIATLGRFAHYDVSSRVAITARCSNAVRFERFMVNGPDAKDWLIHDITIGKRSQFAQAGEIPGDMFASTAIDAYVSFDVAQVSMDIEIIVTNIGKTPKVFNGAMIGYTLIGGSPSSQRTVLPFRSSFEIEPSDPDDEDRNGHHVIIEVDDVLYRVTWPLVRHGEEVSRPMVMTKIEVSDLSARALAEIDDAMDRRELARNPDRGLVGDMGSRLVSIHALEHVNAHYAGHRYGSVFIDESIDTPILTLGDVYGDGKYVEWHPGGYRPTWLPQFATEATEDNQP